MCGYKKTKICTFVFVIGSMLVLEGCSVPNDYVMPDILAPALFSPLKDDKGIKPESDFYTLFEDKFLNKAVNEALLYNNTLKKAFVSLKNSRLNLALVRNESLPDLNLNLKNSASRSTSVHQSFTKRSALSLSVSYTADIFNKLEVKEQSALSMYEGSKFAYMSVRLAVIESVCMAYFQAVYENEALSLASGLLKESETRLSLVEAKYKTGDIDVLEYDRVLLEHKDMVQNLSVREHNLKASLNALKTLLGKTFESTLSLGSFDEIAKPEIITLLPLSLLKARPDLGEAAFKIRQAAEDVKLAELDFFPDLTLSAAIESGSAMSLGRFLADPVASLGAAITLPFVNYNRLLLKESIKRNEFEIAEIEFYELYIKAVNECEDAINAVNFYCESVQRATEAYTLALKNYTRTSALYNAGDVSLLELLDASKIYTEKALALNDYRLNLFVAGLKLMIALGGGHDAMSFDALSVPVV